MTKIITHSNPLGIARPFVFIASNLLFPKFYQTALVSLADLEYQKKMSKKRDIEVEELVRALHQGLRREPNALNHLAGLVLFKEWVPNEIQLSSPPAQLLAKFLNKCLEEFQADHEPESELLRTRFINKESIKSLALKLALSPEQFGRKQRLAINTFANWVHAKEWQATQNTDTKLSRTLPPASYTRLIGVDQIAGKLIELLNADDHGVISLVGLGGIGKTALADWVVRQTARTGKFTKFVWLQIEYDKEASTEQLMGDLAQKILPTFFPKYHLIDELRKFLKSHPTLVILDNFDAITKDPYEFELLNDLASPSKFLLTSRSLPTSLSQSFVIGLSELDFASAKELFTYEVGSRGLTFPEDQRAEYFQLVYSVAGGNPLALRLIAGLLHVWSLPVVRDALRTKATGQVDQLYRGIYELNWKSLSRSTKNVLLAFRLISSEGATTDHLQAINGLRKRDLFSVIFELRSRSLLDKRGDLLEPRYGIHQLTQTFINSMRQTSVNEQTQAMIERNIAYWKDRARDSNISLLRTDKHNLELAVKSGLASSRTVKATVELLGLLFRNFLALGHGGDWLAYFEQALRIPRIPRETKGDLYYQLGSLYWQVGDLMSAAQNFKKSTELAPTDSHSLAGLNSKLGLVLCLWATHNHESAWKEFEKLEKASLKLKSAGHLMLRITATKGILAFARHDYKIAIQSFEQALASEMTTPAKAQLRMNLGLAFVADRKLKKAGSEYDKAAALLNSFPGKQRLLGKLEFLRWFLYIKRKKNSAAAAALKRAAENLGLDEGELTPELFLEAGLESKPTKRGVRSIARIWDQMGGSWLLTDTI